MKLTAAQVALLAHGIFNMAHGGRVSMLDALELEAAAVDLCGEQAFLESVDRGWEWEEKQHSTVN